MLKKLMMLGVCALFAAGSALYSAPAAALTGWWFAAIGPTPNQVVFFFGGSTHELCLQTLTAYESTFWGMYPWALTSDCFQR